MPFTPPTEEQLAAKVAATRTAAMRAAMKKRAEIVANSEPRDSWKPENNQIVHVTLVDFDCRAVTDKTTKKELDRTNWMLRWAINDPSHEQHGKTFATFFTLWPPNDKQQYDTDRDASRIRQNIEAFYDDPEQGTEIGADETKWAQALSDVIQADPPLVWEARAVQITRPVERVDPKTGKTIQKEYHDFFLVVNSDITAEAGLASASDGNGDGEGPAADTAPRRSKGQSKVKPAPEPEPEDEEEPVHQEEEEPEPEAEEEPEPEEEEPPPPQRRSVAGRAAAGPQRRTGRLTR